MQEQLRRNLSGRSHTLRAAKKGRLCAAGENGLQDISTLLPGLIGFIDFLVVLPPVVLSTVKTN